MSKYNLIKESKSVTVNASFFFTTIPSNVALASFQLVSFPIGNKKVRGTALGNLPPKRRWHSGHKANAPCSGTQYSCHTWGGVKICIVFPSELRLKIFLVLFFHLVKWSPTYPNKWFDVCSPGQDPVAFRYARPGAMWLYGILGLLNCCKHATVLLKCVTWG